MANLASYRVLLRMVKVQTDPKMWVLTDEEWCALRKECDGQNALMWLNQHGDVEFLGVPLRVVRTRTARSKAGETAELPVLLTDTSLQVFLDHSRLFV